MAPDPRFEVVLATRNPGKMKEMGLLLDDLPVVLRSISEFGNAPEVEEDEPSLQGNAIKKAQALYDHTGIGSLADDTGLKVDALNGRPGVHSARYAGENATDRENRSLLLQELNQAETREARFCTVVAYVDATGIFLFEGTCEGHILDHEAGSGGFGYDSVFQPEGHEQSFAEMDTTLKNSISHRGVALRKFRAFVAERTLVSG